MRRHWCSLLTLAAVVGMATAAAAANAGSSDAAPSLEYRPPRKVIPEPKAPHPMPPKTVFAEIHGGFGIMTESFDSPIDVTRDAKGNYFVLDAGNNRIQKFDKEGDFLTSWGSYGFGEGQFNHPSAIVIGPFKYNQTIIAEALYVVDTDNDRIQVFDPKAIADNGQPATGVRPVKMFGSRGTQNGQFKAPRDLTIDTLRERIYVLDSGNERVQRFELDGKTETGITFELRGGIHKDMTSIVWSSERLGLLYILGPGCLVQQFNLGGGSDGTLMSSFPAIAPESELCVPARIRIDRQYLYVLDVGNSLLMCFNPSVGGMYRWALKGAQVPFSKPFGVAVNPDGDEFLIADTQNNIVQQFTLR